MPANEMVEKIIGKLEQKMKVTRDDNPLKHVLADLITLLHNANDWHVKKLDAALDYIECIRVAGSSGAISRKPTKMIGEIIAEEINKSAHSKFADMRNDTSRAIITTGQCEFILDLYHAINQLRKVKTQWEHSYPLTEGAVVQHAEATEWQHIMMKPVKDKNKAYRDFHRDWLIQNNRASSIDDAKQLIDKLLANTNYNESEKAVLKEWLMANGGQDNNRIVDRLFNSGEFTKGEPHNITHTKMEYANWDVVDGQIQLVHAANYYSLSKDMDRCLVLDLLGNTRNAEIEIADNNFKKGNLAPLMRIEIVVRLDLMDGVPVPAIAGLKVTSFSEVLELPELKSSSPSLTKK